MPFIRQNIKLQTICFLAKYNNLQANLFWLRRLIVLNNDCQRQVYHENTIVIVNFDCLHIKECRHIEQTYFQYSELEDDDWSQGSSKASQLFSKRHRSTDHRSTDLKTCLKKILK